MTLTNPIAKIAATVVAVSLVVGFAFAVATPAKAAALTQSQIQAIVSLLQSFGADAATVANVTASLNGQQTTTTTTTSSSSSCTFTRDLTIGSKGADVTCLQTALIAAGYSIPAGATGYFGAQTQAAVSAWQKAAGVTPTAGYFGARSRAAWGTSSSSTTTTTTTPPAGTGLMVSSTVQPSNGLSPQGATRVPFTNFNVTAGNDGDVVVNSVQVQRTGFGQDAAFAGVVLVDLDSGKQIGIARTFNSNHQTAIGDTLTVPRGTTRHFQVAGNMNSSLILFVGEAPSLSVVGINTTATVTGTLPITGAFNTNNSTLTVGTLTISTSNAFSANTNSTQNIGTTAYKQTGLRLTAGSSEDILMRSIRWNQTGSVGGTDITNVMTYVNGTGYPTQLSADGKYYDTNLGAGVLIPKGNQIDVYVQYDIVGANASGRTVIFDVDKNTDIYGTGVVYGFGVSPAASSTSVPTSRGTLTVTNGSPFVYSTQVTVSGASVTTIAKATEVPAQNIAINLPNQPLGGYIVDLKGEAMSVQSTVITIASTTGSGTGLLTGLTIVDDTGAVVAGPVDAAYTSSLVQTATFNDTITYKTGRHVFTIRGKVASTIGNGGTYIVTMDPSAGSSGWNNPKGVLTGNTISLSANTSFTMNTMTVKAGAVAVGRATSPASQTIVPGGTSVLMANFQFDATQSGEDVRFSSVPVAVAVGSPATVTKLSGCQIFNGATALNTGSNVLNPSSTATSTVTLDNPVTVAKGSVTTLGIRCNISGSVSSGTFMWDIADAATGGLWTFTGATSGTSITGSDASDTAVTITIGSGSVAVTTDSASPGYTIASAGVTGVTGAAYKLRASNEDINLTKLGLTITSSASSSSSDLVKASIYDGATKVGEAYFLGSATTATSTFSSPVVLVKNVDKTLTVKLDLAAIGTGQPNTASGHLIAMDYLNAEGTGAQSGSTFTLGAASGSTSVTGVRVFKSYPTLSQDSLPSTGGADGRLLRFKVTADAAGPVGLTSFSFVLATSTTGTSVTAINLFGFTDSSYSQPISGVSTGGQILQNNLCSSGCTVSPVTLAVPVQTGAGAGTVIQVPASGTRYFELRGSVTTVTGSSIVTTLSGDSAFPSVASTAGWPGLPMVAAASTTLSARNFIWSPNSTTTSVRSDVDWTDGYGLPGLPSSGIIQSRSN